MHLLISKILGQNLARTKTDSSKVKLLKLKNWVGKIRFKKISSSERQKLED